MKKWQILAGFLHQLGCSAKFNIYKFKNFCTLLSLSVSKPNQMEDPKRCN